MADIATMSVSRSRLGVSLPLLAGLTAYALTLAFGSGALGDPDIFWHIVTGRWIVAHGAVPHHNLFSYTMPDAAWVAHEWLAEPLMAWLYDHFGWHGLVMMAGAGNAATMALFCRFLLRYLEPPHALFLLALAWLVLLQHTLARPHIVALPLMVAWCGALVAARAAGRAPPPVLALLMIPWVNLHGSFLFGLFVAGYLLLEAGVTAPAGWRARWAAVRGWLVFIGLAVAASLVTPNGISAYLLPVHLLEMKYTLSVLSEWQSVNFQSPTGLEIWLIGTLGAMLLLGVKLPWARLPLVALMVHMALQHARHGELLAFVAPLLAAPAVGAQLAQRPRPVSSGLDQSLRALVPPAGMPALAAGAMLLVAASMIAFAAPVAPDKNYRPAAAVDAALKYFADAHEPAPPVLDEYAYGGYLIFRGVPTFIDGRADMFGDAFIEADDKATALRDPALPDMLEHYQIGWTLFSPKNPAVALLDRLPGWRRLHADDTAVVHVRDAAPVPAAGGPSTPRGPSIP